MTKSRETPSNSPSRWIWLLVGVSLLILVLAIVPFRRRMPDFAAEYDRDVEEKWLPHFRQVDPIEYLEKGGRYQFNPEFSQVNYDSTFFLPLLKRLRSEFDLKFIGFISPELPDELYAVAAELPGDRSVRARLQEVFKDEETRFAGAIQDRIGHRWLELDYFPPGDEEFTKFARENAGR